jgi:hypothetical protein
VGHHGHQGRHVGAGGGVEHAAHALRLVAGLDQLHPRQDQPRPAGGVELHWQGHQLEEGHQAVAGHPHQNQAAQAKPHHQQRRADAPARGITELLCPSKNLPSRQINRVGLPQFHGHVSRHLKRYFVTFCLASLKGNWSRITDRGMKAFPIVVAIYPHPEIA